MNTTEIKNRSCEEVGSGTRQRTSVAPMLHLTILTSTTGIRPWETAEFETKLHEWQQTRRPVCKG